MRNKKILGMMVFTVLFCVDANAGGLHYESVWNCDRSKPNWYCDQQPQAVQEQPEKAPQPKPVKVQPKPANLVVAPTNQKIEIRDIKNAEQLRAELKRREDMAVMQPTEQNLKDYLEIWTLTQDKASEFADSWRRVVWQNPEFDYSIRNPHNNSAIRIKETDLETRKNATLVELAKEHGLIFFFRSDCRFCHAMAPTLRQLSVRYGVEVLAVSIDGAGLAEYPNFVDGRAVAQQWGVNVVPAVFIASKKTKEHAPIGYGVMALNEIIERIFVLTNTKIGESF